MPTAHTVTTLYNMALDYIGEFPVSSPSDTGPYARWLNRNFSHYVQMALREEPWNFAIEMHELTPDVTEPDYRWDYSYTLPAGWLRVLGPTYLGERGGEVVSHQIIGNAILTNVGTSLPVEIVMDVQAPGEWDPLFAGMIAARLAYGMAHRFTAKASYAALAKETAADFKEQAAAINAFEGSLEPIEQFDILRARARHR